MSLLVLMPLEPPLFPKAGSILLRGLLGEIQGIQVKIRVLGEARLLGPMPHRGAHFGSQAVLKGVSMHSLRQKQVPRSDLPTGGRISFFLKAWEKNTLDVWTISVVQSGYRIQFCVLPRLLLSPPKWYTRMPKDPFKMEILKGEVESLLQKKAIKEVTSMHPKRGFFSRIFLVQKRTGGWRPVIDLSRLNQFVLCPHFKMETLNSIRLVLQKGDWISDMHIFILAFTVDHVAIFVLFSKARSTSSEP